MIASLTTYFPSVISNVNIPEFVKSSLSSLSEKKASIGNALTEVCVDTFDSGLY